MARLMSGATDPTVFTEARTAVVSASPAQAFTPIRRIGGTDGWYFANSLWHIRHLLDRVLGRPVVALRAWRGVPGVAVARTPREAVARALALARRPAPRGERGGRSPTQHG